MRSMAFVPIIKLEVPLPGPVKAAIISAPILRNERAVERKTAVVATCNR
jgi:hypothetical protein